ncbi:xanthine dehydrogenase family protein molybdopterin-binding subunit [Anaeromicrobium sediminis]|uniref:Aldehyde oxidase/xanthine dehydrogenase a/b hammerhead domain-containing protein n=1 Tax=Anaeromicrobium sediminis TaxID=1478221 RepID=A0A267MIS2_9FIRM|nr:molybdopterin cofactor-binding domain-containing protein [Anaeromicrobium sediminis]PAB59312.1 hypothetical protein CCE28_10640 [Anaeromicrobium sediminis]
MKNFKYVGKTYPIHDIKEKVTGKVKYVGDMKLNNMLYSKLILSNIANGRVKSINYDKAEALEGVVKVFTPKDSPDTLYNSHKWFVGLEVMKDEKIFTDEPKFVGDRIGAIVAENKEVLEEAASLIEIEYEEYTPIIDPKKALKEDGYHISTKKIEVGNVETVDEEGHVVVETSVHSPKVHHAAMENHSCVTNIDEFGNLTVYTPCQVVYQVRLLVAEILDLPLNKVRVIKTVMGGSFGGKGQPILEPVCAYLSYKLKRPVQLTLDRKESIIATRTRHAIEGNVKTIVSNDGKLISRDMDLLIDAGGYFTNGDAVAMAMAKKSFRLYKVENQRFKADIVYTNTPVGGACRGYGSPQIHVLSEINMDMIAKKLNMDPIELRLKNVVKPNEDDPTGGTNLGNVKITECLEEGAQIFNWNERKNVPKSEGRYVKGIGVACATHGNGYYGAYQDFIDMYIRINEDGTIYLNAGLHDQGCGTITSMQQIIAEVLDVDLDKIFIPEADTLTSPFDSAGTQASRVTFVCGGAAMKAAEKVKKRFLEYAAKVFECDLDEIHLEDGVIKCNDKELSYGEMVIKIQTKYEVDVSETISYKSPANPAVYCVNFAEVEVDKLTGLVRVTDFLAVHDIGQAINRGMVEGQVQGAIQMGIGMALTEEITADSKGRLKGDTFAKYHVINVPDMPEVKVHLIEEPQEMGPFGAKSVGEISACAAAPAVVNAINHALGTNICSLPVIPEKIIDALNS